MYLLGYDIGTSSVKASLVDASSGKCVGSCQAPSTEAPIISHQAGWAEQEPESWWNYLQQATRQLLTKSQVAGKSIVAIGISYQMHGLVCVDRQGNAVRPSIIWCDGRAAQIGQEAFDAIGHERALSHLLNSPSNFTAAKLAWVKKNEPEVFSRIHKIMLPGDYIAMRLSGGCINTTAGGLSEGIFWDFKEGGLSRDVMDCFGFDKELIPDVVPAFAVQCRVADEVALELGLASGTPIAYRAGDQPNNALSLNVMRPGQIAATAGTSGVVYGVSDTIAYDPQSRVNTFAHVGYTKEKPLLGILLCINGTGILNAWTRRNVAPDGMDYDDMNELAQQAPIGCEGLSILPFGNGAERILQNADPGCSMHGINFNIHRREHILRAAQEGIAFSLRYGIDIMRGMGMTVDTIHAGNANMMLSPLFRTTLATVTDAAIELYDTDGAAGAAKGAGIGAGIYSDSDEAFATLELISTTTPDGQHRQDYMDAYDQWKKHL